MRELRDYLLDIKNECEYLINRSSNLKFNNFISNEDLKKSFIRSFEIIGEAAKQIPNDIRKKYPLIKWKSIVGIRNKLIHEYFGIDYTVVWKTVKEKIPELHNTIQKILKDISKDE